MLVDPNKINKNIENGCQLGFSVGMLLVLYAMYRKVRVTERFEEQDQVKSHEATVEKVPNPIRKSSFRINFSPLVKVKKRFLLLVRYRLAFSFIEAVLFLLHLFLITFFRFTTEEFSFMIFEIIEETVLNLAGFSSQVLLFYSFYYLRLLNLYGSLNFLNLIGFRQKIKFWIILHLIMNVSIFLIEVIYRLKFAYAMRVFNSIDINNFFASFEAQKICDAIKEKGNLLQSINTVVMSLGISILGILFIFYGKKLRHQEFLLPVSEMARYRISFFSMLIGTILAPNLLFSLLSVTETDSLASYLYGLVAATSEFSPIFFLLHLCQNSDKLTLEIADPIPRQVGRFGE